MVLSVLSAPVMYCWFVFSTLDYVYDVKGTQIRIFEVIGPTLAAIIVLSVRPVIEDSHSSILLLMGTAQSGFLANILMILYENNKMVDITYMRVATTVFGMFVFLKWFVFETIFIPKLPLRIHWKSIILITMFFASTAFFMYPYTAFWNLFYHFYIYLLCIEASIWYYTKEFRLYLRYPRDHGLLYLKAPLGISFFPPDSPTRPHFTTIFHLFVNFEHRPCLSNVTI